MNHKLITFILGEKKKNLDEKMQRPNATFTLTYHG